jgi:hypothetical protein
MPVAPQQETEIVKPGNDALKLDAVDEKNGQRNLGLANMIEKSVLKILRTVGSHCFIPFFVDP